MACNQLSPTHFQRTMSEISDADKLPEITQLIKDWKQGSSNARDLAVGYLYDELYRTAKHLMHGGQANMTMNATALVNETFLRLDAASFKTPSRHAFRALAGTAMRRLLLAYLRDQKAVKRGGGVTNVTLHEAGSGAQAMPAERFMDLHQLLEDLQQADSRKFRLCEAHYFAGMDYQELAELEQISESTVARELRSARAWLKARLHKGEAV